MSAICSYFEIKSDVLSSYWAGCRDKGTKGQSREDVVAWVLDQWDAAYDHPFEKLMFHVVALVLAGPWDRQLEGYHRTQCETLIEGYKGVLPFELMSEGDYDELRTDLKILMLTTSY